MTNDELKGIPSSETESIEDYYKRQIADGYITKMGKPIKCICGCKEFKAVKIYYGTWGIEEYSNQCTNPDCLKIVGHWAYGHWSI